VKLGKVYLIIVIIVLVTTGCWDRQELNDQTMIFAWGMDLNPDGSYEATAQMSIPHKMKSEGADSAVFTMSGKGNSIYEAAKDIQNKTSRAWFAGHRKVIIIGEKLAESGLTHILDEYSRNPIVRLRTDILVLKGGSVKDFLSMPYPLEPISANAILRLHQTVELDPDLTLRDFIMANISEETCPILPVVSAEINSSKSPETQMNAGMKFWGTSIFNKEAKQVAYMPFEKSKVIYWIQNQLGSTIRPIHIQDEEGEIVTEIYHLSAKIKPSFKMDKAYFKIELSGKGVLRENNTSLDLSQSKFVEYVQKQLNEQTAKEYEEIVKEIQKLETDVLGLGEAIHRYQPQAWKNIKKDWPTYFANADISIAVSIQLQETGMTGPSMILKDSEIKR